jgi:hypothetical protein
MTVLGKVPYPAPIQNNENGAVIQLPQTSFWAKWGNRVLRRLEHAHCCTAIFSRRNIFARKVNPQFPNGIVSRVLFVSTTNTARNLAGFVWLALALTLWRSPVNSEKLCPAV